ncbi:MAG: chorismate-binding protein, partial [Deltaproteobacteria bacterium]|nr:chorismate-binding protein [Deltaproteobacteria bacterium]
YPQVHHLVSTNRSKRDPRYNIIDCLAALSPGGSITGAPKIRAMEIIRELEPVNRGVYTGAIGWLGPQQTAHFNIAIRTIVTQEAMAYFSCGGGIVIDSNPQTEYEESLTKALGMMKSLGL